MAAATDNGGDDDRDSAVANAIVIDHRSARPSSHGGGDGDDDRDDDRDSPVVRCRRPSPAHACSGRLALLRAPRPLLLVMVTSSRRRLAAVGGSFA